MSPLRSSRGPCASGGVGAEDDLDGSVLLLLEGLVGSRALGERDAVGGEAVDAERVALGQQRHDVVDPALDVGLAHSQLDLLVERSEEHTSELQSLMRISYAVFCLKKKKEYKNR